MSPRGTSERGVLVTLRSLGEEAGDAYWVLPPSPRGETALVLHGYGQSKAEGLAMAIALAEKGFEVLVPDMPGHGTHPQPLTADHAIGFAERCHHWLAPLGPVHAVGFSLGARLALSLPAACIVAVSPPGAAQFEGARRDLLRDLRPRLVREASPLAGLGETLDRLADDSPLAPNTLLIAGQRDLGSVRDYVAARSRSGQETKRIGAADHHGTWWHPETTALAVDWLQRHQATRRAPT